MSRDGRRVVCIMMGCWKLWSFLLVFVCCVCFHWVWCEGL